MQPALDQMVDVDVATMEHGAEVSGDRGLARPEKADEEHVVTALMAHVAVAPHLLAPSQAAHTSRRY